MTSPERYQREWPAIASVYVAGASAETERAHGWIKRLINASPTIMVTSSWTDKIRGGANPNPRDGSRAARALAAERCLREIDAARFFWLLVPPVGVSSAGAWVELQHARERGLQVIASGDTRQSVFTALVPEYDDDAAAFEAILSLCGVTP